MGDMSGMGENIRVPAGFLDKKQPNPAFSVCVYDNPATCCREIWVNGELGGHISEQLVAGFQNREMTASELLSYPNWFLCIEPFVPGLVRGDIGAITWEAAGGQE